MEHDSVTQLTEASSLVGQGGPPRDSILLGKYRVETVLGFGGAGLVIKARHLGLDEFVAIKMLRDDIELDGEHVERFLREAKAAVRLKSEHVARISDVGVFESGKPYMVMELLEGIDLGRMILDHERIEPAMAVDLMLQACDGLAEAHSLGIIHRDVKPTNLFVSRRRDGSALVKVLDFGISKGATGIDMSLTQTSSLLGTPTYMSPEQLRSARSVDTRTDIWSLGCVLYEMVEGVPPFDANNFADLCVKVSLEPPPPLQVAPQLEAVIRKCLEKSVEDRYASIKELAAALIPFASDPEQAKRAVARIARTLDRASVPFERVELPRSDGSSPRLDPSEPRRKERASSAITVFRSAGGARLFMFGAALAVIAIGVAGGMWYTLGRDDTPHRPSAPAAATATHVPAPPSPPVTVPHDVPAAAPTIQPVPAALDEADAITQAGERIIREPIIRKPPRRAPPPPPRVRKPPAETPPAPRVEEPPAPAAGSATHHCNPFDARDSCK